MGKVVNSSVEKSIRMAANEPTRKLWKIENFHKFQYFFEHIIIINHPCTFNPLERSDYMHLYLPRHMSIYLNNLFLWRFSCVSIYLFIVTSNSISKILEKYVTRVYFKLIKINIQRLNIGVFVLFGPAQCCLLYLFCASHVGTVFFNNFVINSHVRCNG